MSAPLFCFYAQVDSGRGVDGRTEFVVGIAAMLQFLKDRTMHSILTVNALVFMEVPPPLRSFVSNATSSSADQADDSIPILFVCVITHLLF